MLATQVRCPVEGEVDSEVDGGRDGGRGRSEPLPPAASNLPTHGRRPRFFTWHLALALALALVSSFGGLLPPKKSHTRLPDSLARVLASSLAGKRPRLLWVEVRDVAYKHGACCMYRYWVCPRRSRLHWSDRAPSPLNSTIHGLTTSTGKRPASTYLPTSGAAGVVPALE